ncbi:MAG: ribonuclease P protein component [Planctomycetales bacterium]|nr:ribonuclease P protein component [Planctomycetales bacterium]
MVEESVLPADDESLPKTHRLRSRAEFQRVFKAKTSAADPTLIVYGLPNNLGHSRLGLVVSRKVGKAVVRNRWKRLLREAFRRQRAEIPPGIDYVVLPRAGVKPLWSNVAKSLQQLTRRVARKTRSPR